MQKHIGKHIQALREEIGFNQEQLARKIGKSKSLMSFIERTGKVNDETLKEIAKVLKVSFESLKVYPYMDLDSKSKELDVLRKEKLEYEKEIALLKKVIEGQEKIIKLLESQSKSV